MMKNLIVCFLFGIICVSVVHADANALRVLKHRLNQINNNFHAHIIQEISDSDGKVMVISSGKLWVQRPNLFHWHVIDPEESFLISDSKTIWFYVPLIKQVTAYCLKNNSISDNVFLKLLLNYKIIDGSDYDVDQEQDFFYLRPVINNQDDLKSFEIKINDCGKVDQFTILEHHKKRINYYLFNQSNELIDSKKFEFLITKDIQLDDQRNNL